MSMLRPWKCMFLPTVYRHFSLVHAETCLDHVFSLVFPHGPWLNRPWSLRSESPLSASHDSERSFFQVWRASPTRWSPAPRQHFFGGNRYHLGNFMVWGFPMVHIFNGMYIHTYIYMGLSLVMGVQNSWMVYFMENPPQLLRNLHIFLGEWPSSSTSYDL